MIIKVNAKKTILCSILIIAIVMLTSEFFMKSVK